MTKKMNNHLKLVVSNELQEKDNTQLSKVKTALNRFLHFLNKPHSINLPFIKSEYEKKQFIQNYLTIKFADYQLVTGTVGLFPLYEAIKEVEKLEHEGKINSYYKKITKRISLYIL